MRADKEATQISQEGVIFPSINNCKGPEVKIQAESFYNKESSN